MVLSHTHRHRLIVPYAKTLRGDNNDAGTNDNNADGRPMPCPASLVTVPAPEFLQQYTSGHHQPIDYSSHRFMKATTIMRDDKFSLVFVIRTPHIYAKDYLVLTALANSLTDNMYQINSSDTIPKTLSLLVDNVEKWPRYMLKPMHLYEEIGKISKSLLRTTWRHPINVTANGPATHIPHPSTKEAWVPAIDIL